MGGVSGVMVLCAILVFFFDFSLHEEEGFEGGTASCADGTDTACCPFDAIWNGGLDQVNSTNDPCEIISFFPRISTVSPVDSCFS